MRLGAARGWMSSTYEAGGRSRGFGLDVNDGAGEQIRASVDDDLLLESASAPSPGMLLTKLHPPPARDQTVVRSRLLDRLRPQAETKLIVIAAPAGYGKTTLVGTWRELETERRPVGWVTLDEGDNDSVVLWSHVLEAIYQACPRVRSSVPPQLLGSEHVVGVVLPQVVNALIEQGDAGLILDDFHRLSSGPARDSVGWLVEHAPSTFQIMIVSRSEPGLRLSALRAHGNLLELRADDLAFTTEEADALLNHRLQLGLAREDIDDLVQRTEGWPAGLYLAALSLQGAQDRHAFVSRFGGASRAVVDFLVDEVLEAHDPAMQALMLRSSILDRLCGPLCEAVLDQAGAGRLLDPLSRTNLFLVPLDDRGEWYRFHHLFAQLLRVELEHRDPGLAPVLHRRAYAWHQENGTVDEAIEHAIQASAFSEASELIATWWAVYANACKYATVLGWIERIPAETVREDQRLLLAKAWVLSMCALRQEAADAIALVEQQGRLDEGPLPDGFSSVEASLATLRASIPWGDVGSGFRNALRAAELEERDSPYWAVVCWSLGMGYYFQGRFAEADPWFQESAALAPQSGMWIVGASSLAYRSLIADELGRSDEQTLRAEEAAKLSADQGVDEIDGEVHLAVGVSLAARGKLAEALPLFTRAVTVLRSYGQPLDLAHALIKQAVVLRAAGDRSAAAAVIAEARASVDSCPDPGILSARLAALERPRARATRGPELSDRERVILRMLGGSMSERDIGRELYLSHNTVHSHTKSIYRKLAVSSRSDAVERARALGLL